MINNLLYREWFFVHMRQIHFDFLLFFRFFGLFFFLNDFLNSFIVRSRSSFCLVNENSLNCTSGLVLLCFFLFLLQQLLISFEFKASLQSAVNVK